MRETLRAASRLIACCALLSGVACLAGKATLEGELDEDHSLTTSYVTPHTPWGKGGVNGRLSAFIVVNAGHGGIAYTEPGTRLREVVELMQRFDVDAEAVFVNTNGALYKEKEGEARARRLLEKEYDVYVLGAAPFDAFCPELQYKILERVVTKGAALVCCGPVPKKILTAKRALKEVPAALYEGVPLTQLARLAAMPQNVIGSSDSETAARLITCYKLGKGRSVALRYAAHVMAPRLSFRFRALTEYDYWMLLVGRVLLWAAGREAEVALTTDPGWFDIPREALPDSATVAALSNRGAASVKLRVEMALRRGDGELTPLPEAKVELKPGGSVEIPVSLPVLRADDYFVDMIARSKRGVEASGAFGIRISSPVGIEAVAASAPFVERGDDVGINVKLRGEPFQEGDRLRVQLRDSHGRVLVRKEAPAALENTLRFEIGDWAAIAMRAEALFMRDGKELAWAEASFHVPKRRRNQFNFVQWAARNDVLEYYAWRKLGEAGWTVCLGGATDALAACDVSAIPYCTRIMEKHDKDGVMTPVCWNDEPAVNEHVSKIVNAQRRYRAQGTFVYSLGDEGTTKGCCVHPACIDAYRNYLQDQYGTIAGLNASWGSDYKSFGEVDLLDRKDVLEREAVGKGMFARWYDRQAFTRYNLAQFSHRFVEAFKQFDPKAITGFEGTGGFGDDYDAILEATTFWSPYPSIGDDILRGVARREHIRANWMGYHKYVDPLINYSWRMVMKEMDSIWWWRYDGCGSWRGYISPILDFWPATRQLCAEMRVVREGLGDILLKSKVRHSGVAVYYSLPSALSGNLGEGRTFPPPKTDHTNWLRLIYDLGLDVRYVTARMVKSGGLDPAEFKLLLLPMAQGIGREEASVIRRFAEGGGTVLADLRPGLFDDHCKPASPGVLDELFGITRTGDVKAEKAPAELAVALGDKTVALNLAQTTVDPAVAPAAGKALARIGAAPAVIMNAVGAGRAVLLNFELTRQRADGTGFGADAYEFAAALFGLAGAAPSVRVTAPGGGALPGFETRVWQNGEMTIVGVWHEMNVKFFNDDAEAASAGREAEVALPQKMVVYDLRAGKRLGKRDRFTTSVPVGRANFFAALPYSIRKAKAVASSSAPSPGDILRVDISLGAPDNAKATHVSHVEVIDPSGAPALWGKRVVLLPGGKGSVTVPIAWNDAPGQWRLRATELFSRATAEAKWTVK